MGSFLFPRAGPCLLFDVQVYIPKTPVVPYQLQLATRELVTCIAYKENHYV
jgi:hypothetical protein